MPGLDRKLDPVTRDYLDDDVGGFETTRTAETACYHQILGELNAWVGDPEAGSTLHTLPKKLNDRTVLMAKDGVEQAHAPLLDAEIVSELEVSPDTDQRGRLGLAVSVRDEQHGELDLSELLPWRG